MSGPSAAEISIGGFRVKIALIALCCLVAQTTAAVVLTRYSKMLAEIPGPDGTLPEKYSNASLVVSTEFVKFIASLLLVFVFDTVDKLRAEAKVTRDVPPAAVAGGGGEIIGATPKTPLTVVAGGAATAFTSAGAVAVDVNGAAAAAGESAVLISSPPEGGAGAEVSAKRHGHQRSASGAEAVGIVISTTAATSDAAAGGVSAAGSPTGTAVTAEAYSLADADADAGSLTNAVPRLFSPAGLAARYRVWKTILYRENFRDIIGTLKLIVPAVLYTIQNNVIYTALNNLEATTFQVGYQSKVVTTAVLSVLMLNRSLSGTKWLALLILTAGIVLTQLQPATDGRRGALAAASASASATSAAPAVAGFKAAGAEVAAADGAVATSVATVILGGDSDIITATSAWSSTGAGAEAEAVDDNGGEDGKKSAKKGGTRAPKPIPQPLDFEKDSHNNQLVGMIAVMVASFCSAFAGVYFEKILKGTAPSVWVRNAQLAFFSMLIGLGGYAFSLDPDDAFRAMDYFRGYNALVYILIAVQALGGLIIACVVKYADNILKGFATAMSIVLCGILSAMFMGFFPNVMFVTGSATVILATLLYSKPDKK